MMNTQKLKGVDELTSEQLGEYVEPEISVETIRPKFWTLRSPAALSAEGWDEWNDTAKKAFPFRYFIQHNVSIWFHVKWMRINDIWWAIKYRTTNRNHVLNLVELGPGYYDADTKIIFSVFHIFNKFMQHQIDNGIVDWESEFHIGEWTEMNEIWEWWKQRNTREERFNKENPHPELPDEWGFLSIVKDQYREEPVMLEWKRVSKLHGKQEVIWDQEDEDMLIRVMKIRKRLWD
jgi:hypothetical protein